MDFRITGLPLEPFVPFFSMSDAKLLALGGAASSPRPMMRR
jgi:hypothetical protein